MPDDRAIRPDAQPADQRPARRAPGARGGAERRQHGAATGDARTPLRPAVPGAMHHWGARATSVGEIETELARIWGLAAHEAELEGMTPAA
ncbi:MAG TPA: hypothetical protein VN800_03465, partial [Candidatus Acidoferrales bacterium]|nr:hypothetical protein [Candidatus Acidoferrales bacterium]